MTLEEMQQIKFTDLEKALDFLCIMMTYCDGGATADIDADPPRISLRFCDGNEVLVGEDEILDYANEWVRDDAFVEEWGDNGPDGLPRDHYGKMWHHTMVNNITESKFTEEATVMELMVALFTWIKG